MTAVFLSIIAKLKHVMNTVSLNTISMAVAASGALATVAAVAAESMPVAFAAASVALAALIFSDKKGGEA